VLVVAGGEDDGDTVLVGPAELVSDATGGAVLDAEVVEEEDDSRLVDPARPASDTVG
jgi:hypothetical protein